MIDAFKSLITRRGGLSKANRFDVMITLPSGIIASDRGRDLSLLCESTNIPGKQITTTEWSPGYGHPVKIPTGTILEDLTMVFNLTSDFYVKDIFDEWQELVISSVTDNIKYDEEFKTDLVIRALGDNDKPIYSLKIFEAYPITVSSVSLDSNSENTTNKLSVTFAYKSFAKDGKVH